MTNTSSSREEEEESFPIDWYIYRGFLDDEDDDGHHYASHIQVHFSVKTIHYEAFFHCQGLMDVTLSEGLQKIEHAAFAHCQGLTTIVVPSTVKVIQDMAFVECTNLKSVILSDAMLVISHCLFEGCTALKTVRLPRYLQTIKDSAFCRCQSLPTLHLPMGLKRIGDWAMSDCYSLASITVPSTVHQVGRYCFQNCIGLLSIEFPHGIQYMGDHCFADCSSLINLVIPTTFEYAGSYPLLDRTRLKEKFRGNEVESYEDETLVQTLCHRFDDLPVHNQCYHLPHYHSSATNNAETNLLHLEQILHQQDDTSIAVETVDAFGMTPLHILALSGSPNLQAFQLLLNMSSNSTLYVQDIFGCTAMDYLCRNSIPETKSLMAQAMNCAAIPRLKHLGLESWRAAIPTAIDKMLEHWEDDPRDRIYQLGNIHYLLAKLERMESMSLLESLLWKVQIETYAPSNLEERQHCRINCGADIVIPNAIRFLDELTQKKYRQIQQSKMD